MRPSANELTLLGKEVARKYLNDGVPLNDGVLQVKEAHELTDEETRRVIERANTAVLLHQFHMAGDDRATVFDVADPYEILGQSKQADAAEVASVDNSPSFRRPEEGRFHLDKLVAGVDLEKLAEEAEAASESTDEFAETVEGITGDDMLSDELRELVGGDNVDGELPVRALHVLREAADELRGAVLAARAATDEARGRFHKEAAIALRHDGYTVSDVVSALIPYASSPGHLEELKPVVDDLGGRGLLKAGSLSPTPPPPNPSHPLVEAFVELQKAAAEYAQTRSAMEQAVGLYDSLSSQLAARFRSSARKGE